MKVTDNLMKSSNSRPPSYSSATLPSPSNHLRARVISVCVRHVHRCKRSLLTRKARHAILLAQGFALTVRIDLGDSDFVLSVSKRIREFFILGCEVFAVTAVWARHYTKHSCIMGYYATYHQGAKLKSYEFRFRGVDSHATYNSTSAGTPFPIVLSQLD